MIVIQSSDNDFSTNEVQDWLYFFGKDNLIRLNNDLLIDGIEISDGIKILLPSSHIDLSDMKSYWYRRGSLSSPSKPIDDLNKFAFHFSIPFAREVDQVYKRIDFGNNTVGKYSDNYIDKIKMLLVATQSGLKVPSSLYSGNVQKVLDFIEKCDGRVITKAVKNNKYSVNVDSTFRCYLNLLTKFVDPRSFYNIPDKQYVPAFFQEYIDKKYELRVFYLRGKFYSMAIFSQNDERTKIDYRNYDKNRPNRSIPYILPPLIENSITLFMKNMDLDCGSLDLIYSTTGDYVFIEVNPVGQFGWLEENCNYKISKEIAQQLSDYD